MTERDYDSERFARPTGNRFGIDKSLNVGNLIAAASLLFTLIGYGSQALNYLKDINNKVSVMWVQFSLDHPDKAREFHSVFGDNK
jgi:hypothetical protein